MSKRHEAEWVDGKGYICQACGLRICTDCGSTPAHEDSPSDYCHYCSVKAGNGYAHVTVVDNDELRALLGREMAERVMKECVAIGGSPNYQGFGKKGCEG